MALPASDTFTGTAGVDLPVYSSNWVAGYSSGTDVLELDGSGAARTVTSNDSACKWTADTFAAAQYAETIITAGAHNNTKVGPGVRWGTAGNGYGIQASTSDIEPFKSVAGTWSGIGSLITISWSTGTSHTLRLSVSGSTLTIDYDASSTTRSDSSLSSGNAGIVGWTNSGTGSSVATDWTADNLPPVPVSLASIGTKSAGVTATPVSVPYPTGLAAKDLLLEFVNAYNDTATVTTPGGWTLGGDQTGGTGTAADSHTGRLHSDYKEATGSESGNLSVTLGGTISGALGIMAAYRLGDTARNWDVATAKGTDDTHAANRSITAGTSLDFQVDDVAVIGVAVDTDTSLTVTSPTLTVSGVTFGTGTRLTSGAGVTSGNDGNIDVYEFPVTAGSGTAAPVFAFTTATSQCGPAVFYRLRSVTAAAADAAPSQIKNRNQYQQLIAS